MYNLKDKEGTIILVLFRKDMREASKREGVLVSKMISSF